MTLDEFIADEVKQSGKRVYTVADVCRLTEKWIAIKKAAAEPFEGWQEVDVLLFGAKETRG